MLVYEKSTGFGKKRAWTDQALSFQNFERRGMRHLFWQVTRSVRKGALRPGYQARDHSEAIERRTRDG